MARTARRKFEARKEEEIDAAFVNNEEDIDAEDSPPTIDPYAVLGLQTEATADDVKKAYRKFALKHHPDKAPVDEKDAANKKFQEIAFAYAVLSDERRRKRYDITGSTAETLEDDDDFNWLNFYREQFENVVSEEAINKLSNEYKGSVEERRELLSAFTRAKGNLHAVYQIVMLSDILEDDDRFRQTLDEEIANGKIETFPAYERENDTTRQNAKDAERKRRENFDKREAEKEAKGTTNVKSNEKAKPKKKAGGDMADLAAHIQQRQKSRAGGFFDQLEAKYAPKSRASKRATPMEEPPEELFKANRAKKVKKSGHTSTPKGKDDDDELELGEDDLGDSDDEERASKSNTKSKARERGRAKAKT